MQFISGHFIGKYKGKEVDPLKLRSVSALHFLDVEEGAEIRNGKWVSDYRDFNFKEQIIKVSSIPLVDIHFDQAIYQNHKPFRESIHECILISPEIHSIFRKEDYTYGIIEGEIFGSIVNAVQDESVPKAMPVFNQPKISTPIISIPIKVAEPDPDWKPELLSSWRWRSCLSTIFWLFLFSWILWWLLNHRGCSAVRSRSDFNPPTSDTTLVKKEEDSLFLSRNNILFSVYDWNVEDHDTISLYVNGKLIKKDLELSKKTASWSVENLTVGDNKLMIESVNNGTVGPASPTIEINDGLKTITFKTAVYKGSPKTFHLVIK